jgi:aspartyl-tRNA(Asn)/glutamyl-tRNA(Gln) amidotransferase subunit A
VEDNRRSAPTAAELAAAYRRGHSPVDELERLLADHEKHNATINALTHVDVDGAAAAAEASAHRFLAGTPLGLLDGIPVSVKELVAVQGWPHARGSRALRHAVAPADSPLVRRLRGTGAVLWAQTASAEFGWKPLGESLLRGPTLNPGWPSLTPGGSSAGAGAAVAAGLGPIAIGTDAAGSVRIPAAFCGLCAIKPSRGVMDLPGGPFSLVAAAGPITRTVEDLVLALTPFAPASGPAPPPDALRIGFLTDLGGPDHLDPTVNETFVTCLQQLAELGLAPTPVSVRPRGLREAITVIWTAALAAVLATVPGEEHQLEPGLVQLAGRLAICCTPRCVLESSAPNSTCCSTPASTCWSRPPSPHRRSRPGGRCRRAGPGPTGSTGSRTPTPSTSPVTPPSPFLCTARGRCRSRSS